ncbi:hypothetical protein HDV00_010156 [Rhizophlyctis rosea]|nr:hypothetical protein HDV00_010156 [Rhizophlyctis rosea]
MSEPSEQQSSVLLEYTTLLSDLKALEARAANYNKLAQEVNSEEAACLKELAAHRKKVNKVLGQTKAVAEHDTSIGDMAASLQRKLKHVEYQFPRPPHILLRLALGNHAPFSLRPFKLRLEYKREYEIFKMRMTLISCLLTGVGWLFTTSRVLDAIFGFLLLYYYCTCVLREHILMVNGSRIRNWWFAHHYICIFLSGVILVSSGDFDELEGGNGRHDGGVASKWLRPWRGIWPAGPSYDEFRKPFFPFALFIALIQALQYRYQQARLYVLVAMDRARPMDTVAGEGFFSDQLEREFLLLTPFLVAGQVWQMYMSWMLTKLWVAQVEKEWQPIVAATLFGILGAGNMLTTIRTYLAKKTTHRNKLERYPNSPASPPISPLVTPTPASVVQNGDTNGYFAAKGAAAGGAEGTLRQRGPVSSSGGVNGVVGGTGSGGGSGHA